MYAAFNPLVFKLLLCLYFYTYMQYPVIINTVIQSSTYISYLF